MWLIELGTVGLGALALAGRAWWFLNNRTDPRLLRKEGPYPSHPCGFGYGMAWVAVRTRDTARLIEVMRLGHARPIGWRDGVAKIYSQRTGLGHVFVTPPLEQWSLVASLALPHPMAAGFAERHSRLLGELSREFGEAQYFASCPAVPFFGWSIYRNGDCRRGFACGAEGVIWNRGAVTPEETQLLASLFALCVVDAEQADPATSQLGRVSCNLPVVGEADVLSLARQWSIDPTALDGGNSAVAGMAHCALAPTVWRAVA